MPLFHGEGDEHRVKEGTANRKNVFLSLKHCMPYFDAMICGYHYVLHTDIVVKRNENGLPILSWDSIHEPAADRVLKEMPVPAGHYPEGYSALLIHPVNRHDLPFTTVAGLVDYDVYPLPGNVSFHIKDSFEGVIEAGTPIMSIIPIKREDWKMEINTEDLFFQKKLTLSMEKETVSMAHYKKGYRIGMQST